VPSTGPTVALACIAALGAEAERRESSGPGATDRLAFLFITPSGELGVVRSAEVVSFVDRTIETRTDLELDRLDPASIRDCRGRVSCFVQTARPDYDRRVYFLPSGGIAPFSEHTAYVEHRGLSVARYLLVASGVGTASGDILSFTLIDLDVGLAFRHPRERLDRADERALLESATIGGPLRVDVTRPEQLAGVLERLQAEVLKPALSPDHWDPFGSIIVQANVAGAGIYVGDRLAATTRLEPTLVERVAPGRRRIRVEHPEFVPVERHVDVARGGRATVEVALAPRPSDAGRVVRAGALWGGVGLVAAGVALTVAGAVDAANAPTVACVDCAGGFRRISTPDVDDPTRPPEGSGPLTVPLGYSLALTGATWTTGALLTEPDRAPWLAIVLGLVAGGAAYGISEAAQ
jgi:hypothetical protein